MDKEKYQLEIFLENYGFFPDSNKSTKVNRTIAIIDKNSKDYFNECNKTSFHNLKTHNKPRMNIK